MGQVLTHLAWWVEGTGSSLGGGSGPLPHGPWLGIASLPVSWPWPGRRPARSGPPGRRPRRGRSSTRAELSHQAGDLDRVALADARGQAGDLDGQDLGLALAQGDELDHVERLAVAVCPGLAGLEVQDRLGLQGAQERDRRGVHRELHASLLLVPLHLKGGFTGYRSTVTPLDTGVKPPHESRLTAARHISRAPAAL